MNRATVRKRDQRYLTIEQKRSVQETGIIRLPKWGRVFKDGKKKFGLIEM